LDEGSKETESEDLDQRLKRGKAIMRTCVQCALAGIDKEIKNWTVTRDAQKETSVQWYVADLYIHRLYDRKNLIEYVLGNGELTLGMIQLVALSVDMIRGDMKTKIDQKEAQRKITRGINRLLEEFQRRLSQKPLVTKPPDLRQFT
jgi:hypothetical protein